MWLSFVFLATGDDGRWHPGIGDPTLMGWFTVAAYLAAAYLAYRAWDASKEGAEKLREVAPREAENQRLLTFFWMAVAGLLLALGINKQLDLQSFFTEVMRDLSKSQGWYENRRTFQKLFILVMGAGAAGGTLAIAYFMRRILLRVWRAVLGVGFLLAFVVVRAASFHHVDRLLGSGAIRVNWVLELTGIGIIALAAYRAERAVRPPGI